MVLHDLGLRQRLEIVCGRIRKHAVSRLDEIRRRNHIIEEAHKDISFFLSLDGEEDRFLFLQSLDAMEKAAFICQSLKGRASGTFVHVLHLYRDADGVDVDRWYIEGRTKIAGHWYTILSHPDEERVDMYHPTHDMSRRPVLYLFFARWKTEDCPGINGKVLSGQELLQFIDPTNRSLKDMMPKPRPL